MAERKCDMGMIGLGVMGSNLLLNMADHGFAVAGYDKDPDKVETLRKVVNHHAIYAADDVKDFIAALKSPRAVMLLVPSGKPVDAVIADLSPHLSAGDIIIDGGNSLFKDTSLRQQTLGQRKLHFLGVGISGGEAGARHGPSLMPGGPREAYESVRPVLEAIAAYVGGEPCATFLGPGAAGHFVKMVHNGIEYGLMQLIAETYDFMKRGLGMSDDELHDTYSKWNDGEASSFLLEITARIFRRVDEKSGRRLIDEILDVARQKGTGMWTSETAMELQVPTPTIDVAVATRNLSVFEEERKSASEILGGPNARYGQDRQPILDQLENGFYAAMILTYAQGMSLLRVGSNKFEYNLNLGDIARIWRGGCIIRAAFLEKLRAAYRIRSDLANPLLDSDLARDVLERQIDLRSIVGAAATLGIPVPALMASLSYFDGYRSQWLPANLIQAQRDYFGGHKYERIDKKGTFHTDWDDA